MFQRLGWPAGSISKNVRPLWGFCSGHEPSDRRFERTGDFIPVVPENRDVYGFLGLLDGRDNWFDAGVRLDDEFHDATSSDCIL